MKILKLFWAFITFKSWRAGWRRRRYDELKALIVEQHLSGKGGMIVPFKYDSKDVACFAAPMYFHARTAKNERCIFWRKELMAEEVGPPRPKTEVQKAEEAILAAVIEHRTQGECH
jgi:hypothetical protein